MGSGDDTAGDSTGDPPLVAFCENQAGPNLIACSDFDGGNASPWDPYEPQGFIRSVGASKPPAHSAPNFARVVRDDTNVDNAVGQALFGVDFSPSALEFGGASVEMQVRFPAQFEESCGSAPVRLFEIRYGEKGAFTNLVVAASPDEVVVYYFSPGANDELGRFSVPETPPQGGWYRFELELTFGEGAADASLSLGGELVVPSQLTPPAFNPASQDVSVNVGPWFLPGEAPGEGCGYDLDDLRLSGLPSL